MNAIRQRSRWLLAAFLLSATVPAKALTDEMCLKYATMREASGESLKGMAATLQTIKNRARKRGISVCQAIKQPGQFSWWHKGVKISTKLPTKFLQRFEVAVRMQPVVESCTTFFHHKRLKRPGWTKHKKGKMVGNQIYYC